MMHHNTTSTVRFGDMVYNINERILPEDAEGLPYVGLEHLDPESLKIRRWGTPDEVEAQKLRFYTGDIIFGKRRYYQKKLAVADFDGICSAHAMVLRAKLDVVLPEFLPFFMQSEMFFDRAMSISVGSLSPTINWSTLAKQEFPLPPLDEQRRIAEILWAVEDAIDAYNQTCQDALTLKNVMNSRLTLRGDGIGLLKKTKIGDIPSHWHLVSIGDVLKTCQYGISDRADDNSRYPIFRMMNIEDGVIVENDMKYIDLDDEEFEKYRLVPGDILFNRTNSFDLVGKVGIYRLSGDHVFASYLIRLRADKSIAHPEYLNFYLNSAFGQAQIRRFITPGVSQSNINAKNLQQVPFPLPPLEEQLKSVGLLSEIDENISRLNSHVAQLSVMKRNLLVNLLELQSDIVNV